MFTKATSGTGIVYSGSEPVGSTVIDNPAKAVWKIPPSNPQSLLVTSRTKTFIQYPVSHDSYIAALFTTMIPCNKTFSLSIKLFKMSATPELDLEVKLAITILKYLLVISTLNFYNLSL